MFVSMAVGKNKSSMIIMDVIIKLDINKVIVYKTMHESYF